MARIYDDITKSIGNNVVLGAITIGNGARIGAGSVVVRSVPPGVTMVGIPARMVEAHSPQAVIDLEHGRLPAPPASGSGRHGPAPEKTGRATPGLGEGA